VGRTGGGPASAATPFVAIRAVGGAINDVDPDATAYPHRHQNFNVSSVGADAGRFRAHWDELRPHLDGLYLSFETDQRPQRLHDAFPGPTLTRLRELKAVLRSAERLQPELLAADVAGQGDGQDAEADDTVKVTVLSGRYDAWPRRCR